MIPLEKQVTSFELSKQLESLGVKQDSQWYWEKRTFLLKAPDWLKNNNDICLVDCDCEKKENWKYYSFEYYSAFTVAELGEMLPDWADFTQKHYNSTSKETWYRCYTKKGITLIDDFKEADARARMLIHLIENKLMGVNK